MECSVGAESAVVDSRRSGVAMVMAKFSGKDLPSRVESTDFFVIQDIINTFSNY